MLEFIKIITGFIPRQRIWHWINRPRSPIAMVFWLTVFFIFGILGGLSFDYLGVDILRTKYDRKQQRPNCTILKEHIVELNQELTRIYEVALDGKISYDSPLLQDDIEMVKNDIISARIIFQNCLKTSALYGEE